MRMMDIAAPAASGLCQRAMLVRIDTDAGRKKVLAVLSVALPVFGLILLGGVAGRGGFLGRNATGH